MAAERGVDTLSVGLGSGVRLWLARVMHSSKVLMKVAQVALSREACRRNEHKCCRRSFQDPNVTLFRWKRRCATSTVGVASVSAGYCVWMVWTCWTRRSQYRRSSDIFVFRPSGPADTCRIASAEGQICWVHAVMNSYKMLTSYFWNPQNQRLQIMSIVYKQCTLVFVTVQCSSFGRT